LPITSARGASPLWGLGASTALHNSFQVANDALEMVDLRLGPVTPCSSVRRIALCALQRLPGRGGLYEKEPGVIEQFRPGEREAQFEAEWSKQEGGWKFGKRVIDA
jgi:hypothetical protein